MHDTVSQGHIEGAKYNSWQPWVVNQSQAWVDIHGNVMYLRDMDREYCLNVLLFLYEKHRDELGDPRQNILVQALRDRILTVGLIIHGDIYPHGDAVSGGQLHPEDLG